MIGKKMLDAFNEQINAEMYSGYLYLSMSAYFEAMSMRGFGSWMRVQAQEELTHAGKLFHYIAERGGRITLGAIAAPLAQWDSPLDVMENVFKHEQKVTGLINALVDLSAEEKDHAANDFLQWFVAEQVEEEESADLIVQQLKTIGDSPQGLIMLDRELAGRRFKMP